MNRLFLALLFVAGLSAQTASITAPGSGTPTLSGWQYTLTSTCSSCTAVASAEYDVNGELGGISRTPPYSYVWNTYYVSNNPSQHSVTVTYRDAKNNVIATSPAALFGVENNLPQNTCPPNGSVCTDLSVATGEVAQIQLPGQYGSTNAVVSFWGSGAVTQVGSVHQQTGFAASLSLPSVTYTTGNLIAVFARFQGGSPTTIACTDQQGNTYANATVQYNGTNHGVQWCYAKNITGFTGTVTVTVSGTQLLDLMGFQLAGPDATAPLDVNVGKTGSVGNNPTSPTYTLAHPAADEFIAAGFTWEDTGLTALSIGNAWTLTNNTDGISAIQTIQPSSGWYGVVQLVLTAAGDHASQNNTSGTVMVDGFQAISISNTTGTNPYTTYLNTSLFTNQQHTIVVSENYGNCPSCNNGVWNWVGQYETQATFANANSPNQLIGSFRDTVLCVTPSTNCPSSATLTASILDADGGTSAVTPSLTFVASTSAQLGQETVPFSISAVGNTATITATSSNGGGFVTITDSVTGFSRQVWVYVPPSTNIYPHWRSDGSIGTTYTAGTPHSIWAASLFGGSNLLNPLPGYQTSATNYPAVYGPIHAATFNTLEFNIYAWGNGSPGDIVCPSGGVTEANFDTCAANSLAKYTGYMSSYGMFGHLISAGIVDSTPSLFNTVYGPPGNFTTPALQYYFAEVASAAAGGLGFVGGSMADEVSDKWPFTPLLGTDTNGVHLNTSGGPTQIACVSGVNCTVTWSGFACGQLVGSCNFIITGSSTLLDYNTSSGTPTAYHATVAAGGFTFPTPAGLGTTTYTYSGYPNLLLEPLVNNAFDSTAVSGGTSGTNSCPPGYGAGDSSAGPCAYYNHYNALMLGNQQIYTGSGGQCKISITYPPKASNYGQTLSWWNGKFTNMAGFKAGCYQEGYFSVASNAPNLPSSSGATTGSYLNDKIALQDTLLSISDFMRYYLASMDLSTPMKMETEATTTDYVFQGTPISVVSCVGNTITTSAPHGVYNIKPDSTRMTVSGSSGGACDGSYYIIAAPTATTLSVVLAVPTYSGTPSGTITFDNGNTSWSIGAWSAPGGTNQEGEFEGAGDGTCPNTWKNLRGHTFTVASGASGSTFWFTADTLNVCPAPGQGGQSKWRQVPSLSSTGGTAQIIPDNWYRRGVSWQINSETGPRYMMASVFTALLGGASGGRAYAFLEDPDENDLTLTGVGNSYGSSSARYHFDSTDFNAAGSIQGQINPTADVVRSQLGWYAHQIANLMIERVIKYAYGQKLPSPDYGQFFETASRTNANGNVLLMQSYSDNTVSQAANLGSCGVSGQNIIRISASTVSGVDPIAIITAGTMSDSSKTWNPGEFRAYLCPNNFAAELSQPSFAPRVADVINATGYLVQWSYSPLAFSAPSVASQTLYTTHDCGSSSPCTSIPWDRNIGPIYYRMLYYNSSGAVIATSAVEVL